MVFNDGILDDGPYDIFADAVDVQQELVGNNFQGRIQSLRDQFIGTCCRCDKEPFEKIGDETVTPLKTAKDGFRLLGCYRILAQKAVNERCHLVDRVEAFVDAHEVFGADGNGRRILVPCHRAPLM